MVCGRSGTYETYSLSFFVVRTSGSLPRRPTRMSLATSVEREGVDEKACGGGEDVNMGVEEKETDASEGAWLTEKGEHGRRVQVGLCDAV